MQLALDSLDRLVDILEERGSLTVVDAARALFATSSIPDGLARSLLEEVTAGDSRVVCTGPTVSLVDGRPDPLLEEVEKVLGKGTKETGDGSNVAGQFGVQVGGLAFFARHCQGCHAGTKPKGNFFTW